MVWSNLWFSQIEDKPELGLIDWLTWFFTGASLLQRRRFCVAVWALWYDCNTKIHDKKIRTSEEITQFICDYLKELDEIDSKESNRSSLQARWEFPSGSCVKINFDAAYDSLHSRSVVGLVARNGTGSILVFCFEICVGVSFCFAAEALACVKVERLRLSHGWPKVVIEGDSLTVVKKCQTSANDRS